MLYLQLTCVVAVFVIALIEFGLESWWKDARTAAHRKARKWLLGVIVVGTVLTGATAIVEDQSSAAQLKTLEDLKSTAETQADEATKQRDAIQLELTGLREEIIPLADVAKNRYPHVSDRDALKKLAHDIASLETKTTQIERVVAKRALSGSTRSEFIRFLQAQPKGEAVIAATMGNQESAELAQQIKTAMDEAGWKVQGLQKLMTSAPVKGIRIFVGKLARIGATKAAFEALEKAGFQVYKGDKEPPGDKISIQVLNRP